MAGGTAFEALVADYDAARPTYPAELFEALPPLAGRRVLELGAGTGRQTKGLLERGARVVSTDAGPRMLAHLHENYPSVPAVVARAEQLPLSSSSVDGVCGAQMWHWVDEPVAAAEVARVLRPGGWLALWWNQVEADGLPWYDQQQDRLEASHPTYRREYRTRDYRAGLLATGAFGAVRTWSCRWKRELDWPLYERWLRSKSYVADLPDREAFIAAERTSLAASFPDGRIVEPFRVDLWVATVTGRQARAGSRLGSPA